MNMSTVRSLLVSIVILSALTPAADAQAPLSETDRDRWLSELREYKHDFLAKELKLTKEQQREFFPLYDEMEGEIEKVNTETRSLEAKVNEDADAGDLELENAARTVFVQKKTEGEIELNYFDKYKEILSPRQLLRLKNAERRFTQQLVKHHGRMRGRQK